MKAAHRTRLVRGASVALLLLAGCGTAPNPIEPPPPPPFDPVLTVGVVDVNNPFLGAYDVNITGQIFSATGSPSYAQPAILSIEQTPTVYFGTNQVIVSLNSLVIPSAAGGSIGAVRLTTSALRAGIPSDAISVSIEINRLLLNGGTPGTPIAGGAAAEFRPGPGIANGAVLAATVRATLTLNGSLISGTIDMTDVSGLILNRAQIVGTRRS